VASGGTDNLVFVWRTNIDSADQRIKGIFTFMLTTHLARLKLCSNLFASHVIWFIA